MNNKHWLGILLALAGSWLTVGAAQAATTISGNIISPNWTAANSPYIVSENIEVAPGATLTIEAGTVVKFKKNKGITVRGTLKINGNNSNIVVLTSAEATTTRGDWAGITFADESVDAEFDSNGNYIGGSIIKYAVFNHSQGLKLDNSHPYIVNSNFLNNTTAITISGTAPVDTSLNAAVDNHKLLISRNNITNNTIGLIINRAFLAPPMIFDPSGLAANQIKANIVIDGNAINYNQEGIWLQQAQRAAILNNQLNFNNNYGLKISAGAPNAIVQHNTINYNNIGLELAARGANIVKNAIAYNNQAGLNFLNTNNQINNNNIYGNLGYDLRSPLAGGSLANNYWGVATPINASLPTSSSFTIEPRL
ncbi:MAG TPA: right-handed parallel beta-helix repeat-containing protein, partial [bacterium]|nr:right-handed parallel beta-helix repeat-containing protein [bacterium]